MNLGIDPRHADQMVRGMVELPNGTGKTVRVAVFARAPRPRRPRPPAPTWSAPRTSPRRSTAARSNFDRCIATPDMMGVVGRLGKVLGPRGLMPNPKLGTVTQDVTAAVKAAKGGRSSSAPRRLASSMPASARRASPRRRSPPTSRRWSTAINRAKPTGAKGTYIKKVSHQFDHGSGRQARPGHRAQRLSGGQRVFEFRRRLRSAVKERRDRKVSSSTCPRPPVPRSFGSRPKGAIRQRRRGQGNRRCTFAGARTRPNFRGRRTGPRGLRSR